MARYRRPYRGYRSSYSSRNYGNSRAREHINAAERLTRELGGADEKVKQWLFSSSGPVLELILDAYGRSYGQPAKAYAAGVIPKWESGKVKMSGMVAERLFALLPPFMPFTLKYDIVEGLWRHFGPSSKTTIWVSPDVDQATLLTDLQGRIDKLVTSYAIPPDMEARFAWLSADDVGMKQQLLNHLRITDKTMAVESARVKLPVLIEHLQTDVAGLTRHLSQTLEVGKQQQGPA